VGFGVVVGAEVVVGFGVVVGAGVVVCAAVVVGLGVVVAAGDAAAWAGATMELMRGLDHLLGRTTRVATPPINTFKTCRRSCRASFMAKHSPVPNAQRIEPRVSICHKDVGYQLKDE
jgi:uncharacterized protein YcfJ